jgi:hypothetical protein
MTDTTAYIPAALDANQGGRLSDDQRKQWRGVSRGTRKGELSFAVIVVVIGALVAFAPGPAKYATVKPIIGAVCFVIAAILVLRSVTGTDSVTEDVRAGRVESVEGAITKAHVTAHGRQSSITTYYFDVASKRMEVGKGAYDAAPDAGYVRVFYMPRSRRVVNFERLPDPVAPDISTVTPQQVMHGLAASFLNHDENARAEARAQLAAMGNQFQANMAQAAVPPPADQRDPRPLAQAILGSWSSRFMTVTFAPDGTATTTMAGGRQQTGQWSVDAQGHLHAGMGGQDTVGDAWIVGNTLTVSTGAMGLTFERQGG